MARRSQGPGSEQRRWCTSRTSGAPRRTRRRPPPRHSRRQGWVRELVGDESGPALAEQGSCESPASSHVEGQRRDWTSITPTRPAARPQPVDDARIVEVAARHLAQRAGHHPADRLAHAELRADAWRCHDARSIMARWA